MGSLSSNVIPIINLSMQDMEPGNISWSSARDEVRKAFEEYGCFEATFGDPKLHGAMMGAMKDLLDLPIETRSKLPDEYRYIDRYNDDKPDPHTPIRGNMGILDILSPGRVQDFTNAMWPEGNSSFCETVSSYASQGSKLEQMVKRMAFESFGLESCFDSYAESTMYTLRINRYRVPKMNETNLGLAPHTDSSFLTILTQTDHVNGLEIQTKDGEWINVTPSPCSFTILCGDALVAWSNGKLRAPLHRVRMNVTSTRFSISLFAFIKGRIVETPQELVDEKHPLLYKPFDHMAYRRFITSNEGKHSGSLFKAYCGA